MITRRPEVGRGDDYVSQVRAGGQWGPARDSKSRRVDFKTDEEKCGREIRSDSGSSMAIMAEWDDVLMSTSAVQKR